MELGWDLHVVAPEKRRVGAIWQPLRFCGFWFRINCIYSIEALDKVKKLIVGEVLSDLEAQLQDLSVEAFATYGMTETISHVAVRRINGFARSRRSIPCFADVKFSMDERGCLVIHAPKLCESDLGTNDLVELISPISFKWLGRYDFVINGGGIKLHPTSKKTFPIPKNAFIIAEPEAGNGTCNIGDGRINERSRLRETFAYLNLRTPQKVYTFQFHIRNWKNKTSGTKSSESFESINSLIHKGFA